MIYYTSVESPPGVAPSSAHAAVVAFLVHAYDPTNNCDIVLLHIHTKSSISNFTNTANFSSLATTTSIPRG